MSISAERTTNKYYATWYLNTSYNMNTTAGTPALSSWTVLTAQSNNAASLMNTSGQLLIPVKGIYNITLSATWSSGAVPAATWYLNSNHVYRLGEGDMAANQTLSTWTGFCNTSDIITPVFWTSGVNNVQGNQSNVGTLYQIRNTILTITLIQAVV